MSLLLDALKKAADDKKSSQQSGDADKDENALPAENATPPGNTTEEAEQASTERTQQDDQQAPDEQVTELSSSDGLSLDFDSDEALVQASAADEADNKAAAEQAGMELSLDEPPAQADSSPENSETGASVPDASTSESSSAAITPPINASDDSEVSREISNETQAAMAMQLSPGPAGQTSTSTVSDEALTMLIYNTNREIRKKRMTNIVSVILISVLVLIVGGYYFYSDMQAEIDNLDRKHQTAMLAMKAKTSSDEVPEKSEIIRNLVSDNNLDEKVEFAREHMKTESTKAAANKNRSASVAKPAAAPTQGQSQTQVQTQVKNDGSLSIQKNQTVDPVEQQLERAWSAYDAGDYDASLALYENVLAQEANNRDALLGRGAIAMVKGDQVSAVDSYARLLELDPNDPIASASLSNLRATDSNADELERYLLGVLDRNKTSSPLNFAMGNFYARQKQWKQAQSYYFNAWQHDAQNPDYLFNLAVSLDQLGQPSQALRFYQDSLAMAGNRQVSFSRAAVEQRIAVLSEQ